MLDKKLSTVAAELAMEYRCAKDANIKAGIAIAAHAIAAALCAGATRDVFLVLCRVPLVRPE